MATLRKRPSAHQVFGLLLVLFGLTMAAAGSYLVLLEGSPYYLVFGLLVTASGALVCRGLRAGARIYLGALAVTVAWSVHEVGFSFWLLLPRLDVPMAVGAVFLLPPIRRRLLGVDQGTVWRPTGFSAARLLKATAALLLLAAIVDLPKPAYSLLAKSYSTGKAGHEWPHYGNSLKGQRYAPAAQIDRFNVAKLEVAWIYHTGELNRDADTSAFEATPIKIRDTLYLCSPHNVVIALNAETGHERWRYDPRARLENNGYLTCRGVSYHEAESGHGGSCPRRILTGTGDARLIALNADTGRPCTEFGEAGAVDLRSSLGDIQLGRYVVTSAPTIYKNIAIVGGQIFGHSSQEPPGVVRAYDVTTGALVWAWNPGHPGNAGPAAGGATSMYGSPNSWAPPSIDEALGLVYLPTSVQKPDAWGGNRNPKGEEFSSAIVALEAETGRVRWIYQTVHHDVWDWDVGAQPTLVDLKLGGETRPALLAATKRGDIFVLDRRTGEPIVPAPERPVPQGAPPGDWLSPTQPFSELSFQPEDLAEHDMWGVTPFDQLWCRIQFRQYRYQGVFTPQTDEGKGIIVHPGNYGVFNWGGVAVDEAHQLLIATPNSVSFYSRLVPGDSALAGAPHHPTATKAGYSRSMPFTAVTNAFLSPLGIPCNAPPWGRIVAVDLVTKRTIWQRALGTTRDRSALALPAPLGVPSIGGPIITEGGLVFIGAALDDYLRALDIHTGEELWRGRLPAGGQATPMTYISEDSGRQFVVIAAGGHAGIGTRHGDAVVAFALPAR